MAAFVQFDAAQASQVPVLYVQQSARDMPPQHALGCVRHSCASLPRPHHEDLAIRRKVLARQRLLDGAFADWRRAARL